jgi:8-oxo-dGTP pyrophosphatase MutT (NUDIX family)
MNGRPPNAVTDPPTRSTEPLRQTCVIPFRRDADGLQFCLITSLKRKRWIFPKGIIDPGETREETGLKEAWEEAGLHGRIVGQPLGTYEDAKWGRTLHVTVLLMEVTACQHRWLEADVRRRGWFPAREAAELPAREELRHFAKVAHGRLAAEP